MRKSKQKNRKFKRYIRKQSKKAFFKKRLDNFKETIPIFNAQGKCQIDNGLVYGNCRFLAMPKMFFNNSVCGKCIFKPMENPISSPHLK